MTEMEIKLTLRFRVPEKGLTVNGILQGLEEQIPTILVAILEQIFEALEEKVTMRLHRENLGRYIHNGHQRNPRKLIAHFGPFHYRMAQWAKIRKDLEKRLNYEKLEVLFYDGGRGIAENLLAKGMRQQRCL